MSRWPSTCLLTTLLLPLSATHAVELTGRLSLLGSAARAERGDAGYNPLDNDTLTTDQQSLRLMLEGTGGSREWSLHLKTARQHASGVALDGRYSSDLFRYRKLTGDWHHETDGDRTTRIGYTLDRAAYKLRFDDLTLGIGRQPVDWGSGRFWQPLNVFGAFAPTDLDTDFKPGIDAAVLEWYPSPFSSLTAVHAFSPSGSDGIKDSSALYLRSQVGERSEFALLAGHVIGNEIVGASFETDWGGLGWRVEAAHYHLEQSAETAVFWIAGVDYQFEEGTFLGIEWYDHGLGATDQTTLSALPSERLVAYGLQPQLGRRVLGVTLERDITPLLRGSYLLLFSPLGESDSRLGNSTLQQVNLTYSVSNESDLLLSLQYASGRGLDQQADPRSEFGHLPTGLTLRFRTYF
ncbi:hypothetical protein [Sedimenticola sp.]|uniref:hypothetical protein n=1 Tax=Sedimenticola sp. TaxID=1940285 RepID=UPI00258405FC|nr:hypothetical protein [Sedimenticola sp.]MCW8903100.1 hypothetical protein [Sedimenticola sp.]